MMWPFAPPPTTQPPLEVGTLETWFTFSPWAAGLGCAFILWLTLSLSASRG